MIYGLGLLAVMLAAYAAVKKKNHVVAFFITTLSVVSIIAVAIIGRDYPELNSKAMTEISCLCAFGVGVLLLGIEIFRDLK